ncbi:MAG: hypothetical protein DRN40_07340, partial [Thermoplasmata archaeon]
MTKTGMQKWIGFMVIISFLTTLAGFQLDNLHTPSAIAIYNLKENITSANNNSSYIYNHSYIHNFGTNITPTLITHISFEGELKARCNANNTFIWFGDINGNGKIDILLPIINITYNGRFFAFLISIFLDLNLTINHTLSLESANVRIYGPENVTFGAALIPPPYFYKETQYVFGRHMINIQDLNEDGYDDLIILFYANYSYFRLKVQDPYGGSKNATFPYYTNGFLSLIYGQRTFREKDIYLNPHGDPEASVTIIKDLPPSLYYPYLNIVRLGHEREESLVLTIKEKNSTDLNYSRSCIYIISGDNLSQNSSFAQIYTCKILSPPGSSSSGLIDYLTRTDFFMETVDLDGDDITDVVFRVFSPFFGDSFWGVLGTYDFNLNTGIFTLQNIIDFHLKIFNIFYPYFADFDDDGIDDILYQDSNIADLRWKICITDPYRAYSGHLRDLRDFKNVPIDYVASGDWGPSAVVDVDMDGKEDVLGPLTLDGNYGLGVTKLPLLPLPTHIPLDEFITFHFTYGGKIPYLTEVTFLRFNHPTFVGICQSSFEVFFLHFRRNLNDPPLIEQISILTPSIHRGKYVNITFISLDDFSPPSKLTPNVEIQALSVNSWISPPGQVISVNETAIVYKFFISLDREVGFYHIRARLYDPSGFAKTNYTFIYNAFEVLDNPPEVHSVSYEDKTTYRDNSRYQITFHIRDLEDDYNLIKGIAQYSIDGGPWSDDLLQIQRLMGAPDTF